jgi:hypothetical protein
MYNTFFLQGEDGKEGGEEGNTTLGSVGAGVVGVARGGGLRNTRGGVVGGRGDLNGGGLGGRRHGSGRRSGSGGLGRSLTAGASTFTVTRALAGAITRATASTRSTSAGAGAVGLGDGDVDTSVLALGYGGGVKRALILSGALRIALDARGEGGLEGGVLAQALREGREVADVAPGRADAVQGAGLGALGNGIERVSARLRDRVGGGDEERGNGDGVLHFDLCEELFFAKSKSALLFVFVVGKRV